MKEALSNQKPVVMQPSWEHLLFLHWRVPAESLQRLLPRGLELDTFHGEAWIGLVPFTMARVCPRWAPSLGTGALHKKCYAFHETNVRTYVRHGNDIGVWFFSLDAANAAAVMAARAWYKLPYFHAQMSLQENDGDLQYHSRRLWPRPLPAEANVIARPHGSAAPAAAGTLEHFLVERYLLYSRSGGQLWRGRVVHQPYVLQKAEVRECRENLIAATGISRPDTAPHAVYARRVEVDIFGLERAG